jgi:uroporphyrinogen-III synthase
MAALSFTGMRIVSFESRRAAEMAELIRKQGGDPLVAPAIREVPLEHNQEAFEFGETLFTGGYDMMVLLTGVGTRMLARVLATRYGPERFPEALRRITVVARGPKPIAALREMNVPVTLSAPAPNTWIEVLAVTEGRPEQHIAVQEYGRSNEQLIQGLRQRGAQVTPVRVYQYGFPEDTGPLRQAAHTVAAGKASVVFFTTASQVDHLFRIAAEENLEDALKAALSRAVVASIGPTTTEALEEFHVHPDFEPSQSKMGLLVQETFASLENLLQRKAES